MTARLQEALVDKVAILHRTYHYIGFSYRAQTLNLPPQDYPKKVDIWSNFVQ